MKRLLSEFNGHLVLFGAYYHWMEI